MSVHENTLQGLQEALDYVRGDGTKCVSHAVTIPDDFNTKYNMLSDEMKHVVDIIIDNALKAANQEFNPL